MKYGKRVCASLKQVRKQIADANDIPYEVTECKHQGDCRGTCPKCEAELRYIENQLSLRRAAGMAVTVVGLSLGVASTFSACTAPQSPKEVDAPAPEQPSNPDDVEMMILGDVDSMITDVEMVEPDIILGAYDPADNDDPNYVYTLVEESPKFPGGDPAIMQYIRDNMRYPAIAVEHGIQGRVTLSFIIEKDGSISNIDELRSPSEELTKEAKRLVESMPKWEPGKIKGQVVRTKYVLPISFRLQ